MDDPASQPYVVGVGGTTLESRGNPPSTPPTESVWNDGAGGGAGGGGVSQVWRMPAWQEGPGVQNAFTKVTPCGLAGSGAGAGSLSCREVPDVSSAADPNDGGFAVFWSGFGSGGAWGEIGGTSEGAPLWAAIVALADQGPRGSVGDIHAALYQSACLPLAATPGTSPFNDITGVNNDMLNDHGGEFPAGPGYDQASGLGTPIVGSLVPDLRSPPFGSCPQVTAMTPTSDRFHPAAGDTVTISGSNLGGVSEVDFETTPTTALGVNPGTGLVATPTSVTVDIPPSPTGGPQLAHVVLHIDGSTDIIGLDDAPTLVFTYFGPKVTAVSPPAGPPQGGETITITGSGFLNPGVDPNTVTVSLVGAPTVAFAKPLSVSDTTITATVPPTGVLGTFDVEVTNTNGTSQAVAGDKFTTVSAPVVSSRSPTSGSIRGDTTVTILGSGFTGASAVNFGNIPAESFSVVNDGTITASSPASPSATTGDITVTTYGQSPALRSHASMADQFTWTVPPPGYWMAAANGVVYAFGVPHEGPGGPVAAAPTVGMAPSPNGQGFWTTTSAGNVFNYNTPFEGSTAGKKLNKPIVGMAATPDGTGYWLVASDGGIFTFGDAAFLGSTGAIRLNKPVVGMAATPDGHGYWLVASDGGIFSFGDAGFYGSTGAIRLNKPVVGMEPLTDGQGYWLVASDGGIFSFGKARFHGSTGAIRLNQPIVGMVAPYSDAGYWLVARDGGIFSFGVPFKGSEGGTHLPSSIVGAAGP